MPSGCRRCGEGIFIAKPHMQCVKYINIEKDEPWSKSLSPVTGISKLSKLTSGNAKKVGTFFVVYSNET